MLKILVLGLILSQLNDCYATEENDASLREGASHFNRGENQIYQESVEPSLNLVFSQFFSVQTNPKKFTYQEFLQTLARARKSIADQCVAAGITGPDEVESFLTLRSDDYHAMGHSLLKTPLAVQDNQLLYRRIRQSFAEITANGGRYSAPATDMELTKELSYMSLDKFQKIGRTLENLITAIPGVKEKGCYC